MKWRDINGRFLREGDIVEDLNRRVIGEVVMENGKPCIQMMKEFRPELLGYEPLDYKGPREAYLRGLAERHTKLWWWMHRYTLDVVVLKPATRRRRSERFSSVAHYKAPVTTV